LPTAGQTGQRKASGIDIAGRIVKAVLTGDGEARAKEFTTDGIYMPHFDPMQVGKDGKLLMYRQLAHN
jgi:hypothetical protein